MIKLAASDIDGTLVPEGTNELNADIYEVIRRLQEKGVLFAAASGRHYSSMRYLFNEIADDIFFVTENGSCVLKNDRIISVTYIPAETAEAIVRYLHSRGETEIILSTPETLYTESPRKEFQDGLRALHIHLKVVPDLLPYCKKTNKIAVYRQENPEELEEELQKRFGEALNVVKAGTCWIDCMDKTADKGIALRRLQETLHITKAETMAFGDNCNDIGMIKQAGESYAVANAHPALKAAARYVAPSYREDGVLRTLKEKVLAEDGK
ncbi:Cof-like hydrolase [Marvinbryantia formatexigens DSM 14469]|uniref:Cof-like hydrolase n=1 Tax=Marvinbryantia formatexigens DSM 14469 TaxID=478749 RepID=C6LAK3_9FIRM|nr:HAD family hydrolase [Marvinbryantia formatexigens]EET62610.1 Cof-like hydrolase [Marvinbryantia formatexigens DSM 14469]UWO23237.1 Cof-type HAD-IIB family hydrolase [Marvinbryantia formatexigens DSM 14469]SDG60446.1 hypothetical protein SAMN05660368_02885 [Marvinbryantia formatexigens]